MDLLVGETWMSVNPILMINFYVETASRGIVYLNGPTSKNGKMKTFFLYLQENTKMTKLEYVMCLRNTMPPTLCLPKENIYHL